MLGRPGVAVSLAFGNSLGLSGLVAASLSGLRSESHRPDPIRQRRPWGLPWLRCRWRTLTFVGGGAGFATRPHGGVAC